MNSLLRVLCTLAAVFFVVMGLRWLVDPAGVAAVLGMPLLDGAGRSTQIADLAVFFLAVGMMILVALLTSRRHWFLVPALMLLGAAIFRILAWLVHDASFAGESVALEMVVACLLFLSCARLASEQ
ncbi:MAG: hypothetical protein H6984_00250 [Pseudomonadales bacterium]|nr:hypothetical protein [Halioglobus sp.]MCP5120862.1 hypothetical protein [Pseudomonadales bacterium]